MIARLALAGCLGFVAGMATVVGLVALICWAAYRWNERGVGDVVREAERLTRESAK